MRRRIGAGLSTFTLEVSKVYWPIFEGLDRMGLRLPSRSVELIKVVEATGISQYQWFSSLKKKKNASVSPQKFSFNWSRIEPWNGVFCMNVCCWFSFFFFCFKTLF